MVNKSAVISAIYLIAIFLGQTKLKKTAMFWTFYTKMYEFWSIYVFDDLREKMLQSRRELLPCPNSLIKSLCLDDDILIA